MTRMIIALLALLCSAAVFARSPYAGLDKDLRAGLKAFDVSCDLQTASNPVECTENLQKKYEKGCFLLQKL